MGIEQYTVRHRKLADAIQPIQITADDINHNVAYNLLVK